MNIDNFLEDRYLSEKEKDGAGYNYNAVLNETLPAYRDVWNHGWDPTNPDQEQLPIASTGVELNDPSHLITNQVPQTPQITPQFFHHAGGHLLVPDGIAKRVAQDVYQELNGKVDPVDVTQWAQRLKMLLSGIHLSTQEVEETVRPVCPTLADLYEEFTKMKTKEEDILDFGHVISDILTTVIKYAHVA